MAEQVPEDVKHERLLRLQRVIERQQTDFNAGFRGRSLEVLFERSGRHPGQIVGRSPYLQTVQVQSAQKPGSGSVIAIGDVAAVTITELSANSLFGALASEPPRRQGALLAQPGG
jgi:tRNA-2-methylthio-N6-dimethylallyladenosine synthase